MSTQDIKNLSLDKVDKNFAIPSNIEKDDIAWYSVKNAPFDLYGIYNAQAEEGFRRMPSEVAETVNLGVHNRSYNSAGGRVRFTTDSPYLALKVEYASLPKSPTFALSGMCGSDIFIYKDGGFKFFALATPDFTDDKGYERLIELGEDAIGYRRSPAESMEKTEYLINFPSYHTIDNMYIGIKEGSYLGGGSRYRNEKPVVFYGSSITQGGCAMRPGLAYTDIISRKYNLHYINLGFSGSAHGEVPMMEYIAGLDMAAFVYDFDYNTDANGLWAKHYRGYKIVRDAHPDIPIVIMGHPNFKGEKWNYDRMAAVEDTYKRAKAEGDNNVYYIPSPELFGEWGFEYCTADGIHPNDAGFKQMADRLSLEIEKIIDKI